MIASRRTALLGLASVCGVPLAACVSLGGGDGGPPISHLLHDTTATPQRRAQPLVPALLIQPLPGNALADTASIAYSRRPNEFSFYQLATWTERPVRQLPRLLQRRLEGRGLAGAVGLQGESLHSDWLLAVSIDSLHHDVATEPGVARLALTAELFDRRRRSRVARRVFRAEPALARADSAAAAAALSSAVSAVFDALVPWLEDELQQAVATRP
jgi:ABC-type uncharacterized transport system auxiliary subunit